jgi:hypothetical protein
MCAARIASRTNIPSGSGTKHHLEKMANQDLLIVIAIEGVSLIGLGFLFFFRYDKNDKPCFKARTGRSSS